VVASAWAEGDEIEGEIGFSNGDMAPSGTPVEVFGPDNEKLGETSTDEEGLFRFTPQQSIKHIFRANLGAGHVALITIDVDELPVKLAQAITTAQTQETANNTAVTVPTDLENIIAAAVRREMKPLRREIARYKEQNDLQKILGGLGYICGIFGLLFFIYARRNNKS